MAETKIKICGLTRREDAVHAARAGADLLGVVLVPGTPRAQNPKQARSLLDGISLPKVIVVADQEIADLFSAAETVGASIIQLHGRETPELAAELRQGGPWEVWKALRVRSIADVRRGLAEFGGRVHGLLLDGWDPDRMGGTGRTFSWGDVGEIRSEFPADLDFIAAGGLRPENVREALARLRPQTVDVSSGVEERPGIKNPSRVEAFIQQVRIEAREETG